MNMNRLAANIRNLVSWVGVAIAVTDPIPALHSVRGWLLGASAALIAVEHNTQTQPKATK